jgi:ubiquinone/menaquinone biosynthesis C-methylase UbiE
MSLPFPDHFSGVAGAYAEHRPRYPDRLFEWLAEVSPVHELAWDCATGSGQAAVALAARFDRVLGTDASAAQIAAAQMHPRVEYRVAPAEASGLPDASADLVTVAQALHWLDRPAFYAEARRVLRAGGLVAAWTYGASVFDDPRADAAHRRFYSDTVGPFWPAERALVESGYRTIEFPFEPIDAPEFEMQAEWSLSSFLGYVGTWSAVTRFRRERGYDPVAELGDELRRLWGNPETPRRIRWPLALKVGQAREGEVNR